MIDIEFLISHLGNDDFDLVFLGHAESDSAKLVKVKGKVYYYSRSSNDSEVFLVCRGKEEQSSKREQLTT